MKKILISLGLCAIVAFCSCTKDVLNLSAKYTVNVPVDVNTVATKAVIAENAITVSDASSATWAVYASNGEAIAQISNANLGETNYTAQPWVDDPTMMYVLGTKPTVIAADSYYDGKVGGTYTFSNGKITAATEADGIYMKPMSVAFYGIYAASVTTVADTTVLKDASAAYESSSTQTVNYKLSWTDSAKKAQYAVAGFAPTFTVADKITVKTNSGTKTVSATDYPFTIQYIYVGSGKNVTYGENYDYTVNEGGVTKLGLPKGGVFADTKVSTVGGVQDYAWKSFTANNKTFMTLLPTKSTTVDVTLCCWNCGSKTIYTKTDNKAIRPGSWFYIQGTLTQGSTLSNDTNPDCENAGVVGVFMPDVLTNVTINITTLANCESNVTPQAGFTTSFNADVKYGSMSATYTEK